MDMVLAVYVLGVVAAAATEVEAARGFSNTVFVLGLFTGLILAITSTKFISQGYAGAVERMGKYVKTVGPGVHFIMPIFSRIRRVNLKEQNDHYKPQNAITRDNMQVRVDAVLFFRIIDPKKAIYDVDDYTIQVEMLTIATLRQVIGSMTLGECLQSRETINSRLREVLDENTGRYGIKVTGVEINSIEPPKDFREAMEQEKRAEIERNAEIVRSEGRQKAAINIAEGEKAAAIAMAEGDREAMRARAEGERDASRLRAEGQAQAYTNLFQSIKDVGVNNDVLTIRYLEALEKVANGKATTLILPSDSLGVLGSVAQVAQTFKSIGLKQDGEERTEPTQESVDQVIIGQSADQVDSEPILTSGPDDPSVSSS